LSLDGATPDQLDLYADRTSTTTMRANQLRLWFASMTYILLCATRRIGLHDTEFAKATCGTIRLKLLKIGALVRISVRRIKIAMGIGLSRGTDLGGLLPPVSALPQTPVPRLPDTRRHNPQQTPHPPSPPTTSSLPPQPRKSPSRSRVTRRHGARRNANLSTVQRISRPSA
jgi:hypothetical protein